MNEIFLDIETTGLSFKNGHRIVEIACIETKELIPTKKIFHTLINPERNVPEEAFKIHGHSSEILKKKPKFIDIAEDLLSFLAEKNIIVHNAPFDIPFINFELEGIKKNKINKNNIIDSLDIARGKYPGSSNSLDALCRRFGIDLSRRTKHNALLDCELLREVYINLIDAKEPKLSLENLNDENRIINSKKFTYSTKIVSATQDEITLHRNFLKNELKKNYY
tara:strand:+ start:825 stop:1490 length:666 start_codon:yes stop_codon:yes gene_type:complete